MCIVNFDKPIWFVCRLSSAKQLAISEYYREYKTTPFVAYDQMGNHNYVRSCSLSRDLRRQYLLLKI